MGWNRLGAFNERVSSLMHGEALACATGQPARRRGPKPCSTPSSVAITTDSVGDIEKSAKRVEALRAEASKHQGLVKAVEGSSAQAAYDSVKAKEQDFAKAVEKLLGIVRSGDMDAARQAFNDKATRDATAAYLIAADGPAQGRRGAAGQCRSRHRDLLHLQPQHAGPGVCGGNPWWPSF